MEGQDQDAQDIHDFLDLRRGNKDLNTDLVELDYRHDHASQSPGPQTNAGGLSHLILKHCGLDCQTKAQLRMGMGFDLRRHAERGTRLSFAFTVAPKQLGALMARGPMGLCSPPFLTRIGFATRARRAASRTSGSSVSLPCVARSSRSRRLA